MNKFIIVIGEYDRETAINVAHIIAVQNRITTCYIYMTPDRSDGVLSIEVKHTFQEIMDMINS